MPSPHPLSRLQPALAPSACLGRGRGPSCELEMERGWRVRAALRPSITHREAERLLEARPQGCFLVRFSESAVTFVLTYR